MRCAWKDDNGRQCGRKARWEVSVFGDSQISKGWFWVPPCQKHQTPNSDRRRIAASLEGER
jgi:hypothetical protein